MDDAANRDDTCYIRFLYRVITLSCALQGQEQGQSAAGLLEGRSQRANVEHATKQPGANISSSHSPAADCSQQNTVYQEASQLMHHQTQHCGNQELLPHDSDGSGMEETVAVVDDEREKARQVGLARGESRCSCACKFMCVAGAQVASCH